MSDYFDPEDYELADSLLGRTVVSVDLDGVDEYHTYPEIRLIFDDGRTVTFGGVWHNDSTAGVWFGVREGEGATE